jgi:hypothetical protein
MTKKRVSFLQELIKLVGLEGRLRLEWISSAEANKFVKVVTEFTEKIRDLGPNPLAKSYGQALEALAIMPPSVATGPGCACGGAESAAKA